MNAAVQTIADDAFRLAEFQDRLNALADPSERKEVIMAAWAWGLISGDQAELLIQVYQLEAA